MYEEDIAFLFQRVDPNTPVNVVDQPVKIGRQDGELFIEVQPSANQVTVMEETSKSPAPEEPLPIAEWADRILIAAGPDIERLDWPTIELALAQRQGFPVQITRGASAATSWRGFGETTESVPPLEQTEASVRPPLSPTGASAAQAKSAVPQPPPAPVAPMPSPRAAPR
jgi:L,D-transpeptidase ErfK/SrfK